jgi:Ca-activated chloride channel family protein
MKWLLSAARPSRRAAAESADLTTPTGAALLAIVVLTCGAGAAGQFATSVNVVEIYASVTDGKGEPVQGLRRDQFTVLEDGVRQRVDTFVEAEFPLSVAVALDRSLSMRGERLATARNGARTFLTQLRPQDQVMVIAISGQVEVVSPLSTDRAAASAAVERLDAWSTTALHDAIIAATEKIQAGMGRRALVLLSDGIDRYSTATAEEVVARVRGSDVMMYPIALGRQRPRLFVELAAVTGGSSFQVREADDLDATVRRIARELRHQYLIGYSPSRPLTEGRGEWRSIRLEVAGAEGLRVKAREGYVND